MNYLEAYIQTLDERTRQEHAEAIAHIAQAEALLKEPYKEAIQNILKSNSLRIAINKACNEGKPALEILDLALQAIAAMTGDKRFYEANIAKLKEANQ